MPTQIFHSRMPTAIETLSLFYKHSACVGSTLKVTQTGTGKVIALETTARIFNAAQRKAIMLRDGGCVIPGCQTPSIWCEIHHMQEHAKGGPTSIDNGVMLCWYHHRHIELHGWGIRMRDGIVEVCAPGWLDPPRKWRKHLPLQQRFTEPRRHNHDLVC